MLVHTQQAVPTQQAVHTQRAQRTQRSRRGERRVAATPRTATLHELSGLSGVSEDVAQRQQEHEHSCEADEREVYPSWHHMRERRGAVRYAQ